MIIVREVFIAKPGNASKLAKMMKDAMEGVKVMTDMTGVYNKVVVEMEYESVAAWEKFMAEYMSGEAKHKPMPGYTEMYSQGKREIFRVW